MTLTLYASAHKMVKTHSNNLSAFANKLFECVFKVSRYLKQISTNWNDIKLRSHFQQKVNTCV